MACLRVFCNLSECVYTVPHTKLFHVNCSVHSFKAAEVSIGGSQDIRAVDGNWVDVGKQHLSLAVVVPDIEQDSEDPPPDLLDIFYSECTILQACSLHRMRRHDKCVVRLDIELGPRLALLLLLCVMCTSHCF